MLKHPRSGSQDGRQSKRQSTLDAFRPKSEAVVEDVSVLKGLLDVSGLSGRDVIEAHFADIAGKLFNGAYLIVRNGSKREKYELVEVEFYLKAPGVYDDPYTHGSEEQRVPGRWYFHRLPRQSSFIPTDPGGYRSGSRKGVDLTFGGESMRGGILFRNLRRVADGKLISGPSLLVDEILRASSAGEVCEVVDAWGKDLDAFSERECGMWIKSRAQTKLRVWRTARIGIDLASVRKEDDVKIEYVNRQLRFVVCPGELVTKGRWHTFLGVYRELGNVSRAATVCALKVQMACAYVASYEAGKRTGGLKRFLGQSVSSESTKWLEMMGVLDRE